MFGWFKKQAPKAKALAWQEYKGFQIAAEPKPDAGQFRVAGRIAKGEGEERKETLFTRADLIPSEEMAAEFSVTKAKLMIDQLGDGVFDAG